MLYIRAALCCLGAVVRRLLPITKYGIEVILCAHFADLLIKKKKKITQLQHICQNGNVLAGFHSRQRTKCRAHGIGRSIVAILYDRKAAAIDNFLPSACRHIYAQLLRHLRRLNTVEHADCKRAYRIEHIVHTDHRYAYRLLAARIKDVKCRAAAIDLNIHRSKIGALAIDAEGIHLAPRQVNRRKHVVSPMQKQRCIGFQPIEQLELCL